MCNSHIYDSLAKVTSRGCNSSPSCNGCKFQYINLLSYLSKFGDFFIRASIMNIHDGILRTHQKVKKLRSMIKNKMNAQIKVWRNNM
jgi:hypothetical protein